ncbi:MAG: tail fiber domain-containing protein [Saprospiraceae bacterium]|nr:tail fiber domain-containing protein [Saprospiraceae bacterium]
MFSSMHRIKYEFCNSLVFILLLFPTVFFAQDLKFEVEGNSKIIGQLDLTVHPQDSTSLHIGRRAGMNQAFTSGRRNTFVGYQAGFETTTGGFNSFYGYEAGRSNNAYGNSFFGYTAGDENVNGSDNCFFGNYSGSNNISGSYNAFYGYESGEDNTTGEYNCYYGIEAASASTTGFRNSCFGAFTGCNMVRSTRNTFIGYEADQVNYQDSLDRSIAIGYEAKVDCSHCAVIGGTGVDAVNVGIGTTTPLAKLHLGGGDSSQILLENGGDLMWKNSAGVIKPVLSLHTDNNVYLDATTDTTSTLIVRTNTSNDPQMVVDHLGRVGIGTTLPKQKLHVEGIVLADSYQMASSRRWKTNIQILPDALEKVVKLRGVEYDWKDSGKHDIGLIAEEVGAVIPEVVEFEKNGIDAKSVDYARLVPVLIEAIKDLQEIVIAQETRIEFLEDGQK